MSDRALCHDSDSLLRYADVTFVVEPDAGWITALLGFATPDAIINGTPVYDASVPKGRLYGRYLTHVWVWINTLSLQIHDAMCGFRVYPLAPVLSLINEETLGLRMDFDPEILVRLHWRGVQIQSVETHVRYPTDGVSHFDVWRDNVRISRVSRRSRRHTTWA